MHPLNLQRLDITGPAAESFLQRMLSNDVAALPDDRACGAFLLEATGRLVSGAVFLRTDGGFAAVTAADWLPPLQAGLEKYRIADPVEFAVAADPVAFVALESPLSAWQVRRDPSGIEIGWPLFGGAHAIHLAAPGSDTPAAIDLDALERDRVTAGYPWFGHELTTETIPNEAGLFDWLSQTKGCYVGQEVVERMWSRDRTARRLAQITVEGGVDTTLPLTFTGAQGRGVVTSLVDAGESGMIGLGYTSGLGPDEATLDDGTRLEITPIDPASGEGQTA